MSQTFNDGDPIDASTLQNLKTEVARALALSGVTTSGSTITLEGKTLKPGDVVARTFYAGQKKVNVPAGVGAMANFTINYKNGQFTKKPSISLTVECDSGVGRFYPPTIKKDTITTEGASCQIENAAPVKRVLIIHFIAVQN